MKLQVQKLKITPSGQSCWVSLSNGKLYLLPLDYVVQKKIKRNQDLSFRNFRQLRQRSITYQLTEAALRQIAFSPKTKYLLQQKLQIFCHKHHLKAPKTIARVIKHLSQKGYLNDQKFIEYYLKKHHQKGINLLKFELQRLGIDQALIREYASIPEDQQIISIVKLIQKKHLTPQLWADYQQQRRILSAILRKGFSLSVAKSVIDDYLKNRYNRLP